LYFTQIFAKRLWSSLLKITVYAKMFKLPQIW